MALPRCHQQDVRRASRTPSTDASPSRGRRIQQAADYKPNGLLTVYDYAHILDEAVDNLECLSCSSPSFFFRESVQPQQDRLDLLLPEKILY